MLSEQETQQHGVYYMSGTNNGNLENKIFYPPQPNLPSKNKIKTIPLASKGIFSLSLLSLASCSSSSVPGIFTPPPEEGEPSDFIENPTNTFTARSDKNSFFEQKDATADLTVTGKGGNDRIITGDGNDVIRGGGGKDFLNGWGGNDQVYGGAGSDIVYGDEGDDSLWGDGGNDLINGGPGVDILKGGQGDDTLIFFDRDYDLNDQFDGGAGYDKLHVAPKDILGIDIPGLDLIGLELPDFLTSDPVTVSLSEISAVNIEEILLNNDGNQLTLTAQDVVNVTDQNNQLVIDGDFGATVIGDAAEWTDYSVEVIDDNINYSFSDGTAKLLINADLIRSGFQQDEPDYLEPTPGHFVAKDDTDSIIGKQTSTEALTVDGKAGDDWIYTGSADDVINAGGGDDRVNSRSGDDVVYGNDGNDFLSGQGGSDQLYGGNGNDGLYGGSGNDFLYGGEGTDSLVGGTGDDTLDGGNGDDILSGDFGDDIINGGAGDDIIVADVPFTGIFVANSNVINGGDGNDNIRAGEGDIIDGGNGFDTWELEGSSTDFTKVTVTNIEEINQSSNSLTLTLQNVLDITDADNELVISGTSEGTLTSTGQGWVLGAPRIIDGETYNSYTSGEATLLVDTDITLDFG